VEGTNTGHEDAEGMACVGVRLTAQLGRCAVAWYCVRIATYALRASLLVTLGLLTSHHAQMQASARAKNAVAAR
jgi:hypothetical protein